MSAATGIDSRRHNFFFVDNEIIDNYQLGPYAGWLYIVILRHVNFQTNIAFPSLATLSKECGMSEPSVIKYLYELVEARLLYIYQEQDPKYGVFSPNCYEALQVPKVVNEVDHPGKQDLPGVVNEVDKKYTNKKNTKDIADAPKPRRAKSTKPSFPAAVMNPVKDRIVELFGWSWETITDEEAGQVQKAAYSWLKAKGTLLELNQAYAHCLANYDNFGPVALVTNRSAALKAMRKEVPVSVPPPPTDDVYADPGDVLPLDDNGQYAGEGVAS